MASNGNGRAPTKTGDVLVGKDFGAQVASLGEQRNITNRLLQNYLGDQFDPTRITLHQLHRMRKDPLLQMGLYYVKGPHYSAKFHIECEDPKIAAGIDKIIRQSYGPYTRTMLLKYDYGYQGGIKQFQLGEIDGTYIEPKSGSATAIWADDTVSPVVLDQPVPVPPEFAQVKLTDKGKFDGMKALLFAQGGNGNGGTNRQTIPKEYVLWSTNEFEESFLDYYGFPRIGYAYRYWWSYWFRWHMADRHFEQDADPPLRVWYPPGVYKDPRTNSDVTHREIALQMGQDLRGGATIAIPSEVYTDDQGKQTPVRLWDADFLKGGENLQAFNASFEYLDVLKMRSVLVPEQALMEGKGGTSSRNAAASFADIFMENLNQEGKDQTDQWNKDIIPQLKEANFGADAPPAQMVMSGFEEEDVSNLWSLVTTAFSLDPNALPVNFEEILKKLDLPVYTAKEQEERQKQADAKQAQGPEPGAGGVVNASGQYFRPREVINLDTKTATKPEPKADPADRPQWAKNEFARRQRNTKAIQARLQEAAQERYDESFKAAAEIVAADTTVAAVLAGVSSAAAAGTAFDVTEAAGKLTLALAGALPNRLTHYGDVLAGELAGLYHAAGAAELARLNLSAGSWDVGRTEVQDFARNRLGALITTIDNTIVEQHLRPWFVAELESLQQQGVSGEPIELAQKLTDKFAGAYPKWMAERVARTEARYGYNLSSADMWERLGIEHVQEFDGQGGKSGKTDLVCLRRNGNIVTIDEFRKDNEDEHPNGTLGAMPMLEGVELKEPEQVLLASQPLCSRYTYAVTEEGEILTPEQVGEVLALAS